MQPLMKFIDIILHIDVYLTDIIARYGHLTYLILFVVVFCETGLVVTPFLPGDSLLFVAGAFAAKGAFDIATLIGLLLIAAVLGDTVNYWMGSMVGPRVFKEHHKYLNAQYLKKTESFYEKHGPKTIIIARFIPIIRTFAPFVAGVGSMEYKRFIVYNIIGAALWVCAFSAGGYWFGNIPLIRDNFTAAILVIIVLSFIPAVWEYVKARKGK